MLINGSASALRLEMQIVTRTALHLVSFLLRTRDVVPFLISIHVKLYTVINAQDQAFLAENTADLLYIRGQNRPALAWQSSGKPLRVSHFDTPTASL